MGALIDGEGNRTEWKYDLQGRLTKKIYPDQGEIEYHYHEYTGRLDFVVDQLGRTRSYDYWLDGNLKEVAYGQPTGLPETPTVEFVYDDYFDRLTKMTTDETDETTFTYHPVHGQAIDGTPVTEPLGAGMRHEVDGPFDNDTITYSYDELGRLANRQINGTANEKSYDYDPIGRLEEINNPLGKFKFNYVDPTGRLEELIYPNGQVTNFDYHGENDDFRLREIENLGKGVDPDPFSVFEYGYTQTGMIETWSQRAGTGSPNTWTFGYDRAHQLRSATLEDDVGPVLESFGYGYDQAGNRTHERHAMGELDDSPGRGAIHNENNQLTSRSDDGAVRFYGELDQGGIAWVDGQPAEVGVDNSGTDPIQTFETWLSLEPGIHQITIDAANEAGLFSQQTYQVEVADQGAETFEYDAAGNMTKRVAGTDETKYRWDGENRLVEIIYPDNSKTEFEYDGFDRRVRIHEKNSVGGTVENRTLVWDGLTIAEERNSTGATVEKQFFSHGVRASTNDLYYTKDHLGSIREVTDDQGALQARYDYDPYGRVEQTNGTFSSDFLFTGHFYHERSGLHLAPYRAYDAALGRWLSRDPLDWAELLPEGPHLYGYGPNSPINGYDPNGGAWAGGILGGIVGAGIGALTSLGNPCKSALQGALVGGVTGAVTGATLNPKLGIAAGGMAAGALGNLAGGLLDESINHFSDNCEEFNGGRLALGIAVGAVTGGVGRLSMNSSSVSQVHLQLVNANITIYSGPVIDTLVNSRR